MIKIKRIFYSYKNAMLSCDGKIHDFKMRRLFGIAREIIKFFFSFFTKC